MKIALISSLNSIHTTRWAYGFAEKGHEVHVITCHLAETLPSERISVHLLPFGPPLGYFLNAPFLKSMLQKICPDIMNAHYATGYGTLGRLCCFHPYVLSVWGSDVYDFPYKSRIHRYLLRKNLLSADTICSTSKVMAEQVRKVCPELRDIRITPFGVDTELFSPKPNLKNPEDIIIGTVKSLEPKYGIDTLLEAFVLVKNHFEQKDRGISERLRLVIVGGGSEEKKLKAIAGNLGISNQCRWIGRVDHREVSRWLNQFDIYSALSKLDSESFGVAVIEASACYLPVVVSDAGGLPEVVKHRETGFVVPKRNPTEAGKAMIRLIEEPNLRKEMGAKGREHVIQRYEWNHCVDLLEGVLKETAEQLKTRVS